PCIQEYDRRIAEMASEKYGHTKLLRQVKGVGPITSLAYVLTVENPERFPQSRDVGPYLGLVPKQEDSGESQPQLGIGKAGDRRVRKLLGGSAHYILGRFGPDTDLRRYGLRAMQSLYELRMAPQRVGKSIDLLRTLKHVEEAQLEPKLGSRPGRNAPAEERYHNRPAEQETADSWSLCSSGSQYESFSEAVD